jgi:hypothetical protein
MKIILEGKVTTVGLGARERAVPVEPYETAKTELVEVTVARIQLDQTQLKDPAGDVQWQVQDLLIANADKAWLGEKVTVTVDVALPGEAP